MSLVSNVAAGLKKQTEQAEHSHNPNFNKQKIANIVNTALDQFAANLATGKIELKSTVDLDRLVKISLLLSGELNPDNSGENFSKSKLESVLDDNDPEVTSMYHKLFENYNKLNDAD